MSWTKNEIVIDKRTICDLECILDGSFYPLTTFMGENDWDSVLNNMELSNGLFFPLPVNLALDKQEFNEKNFKKGSEIILSNEIHFPIAKIIVSEVYEPDIEKECELAYGSIDTNHPYIKYKMKHKDCYYVSGEIMSINKKHHHDFPDLRKTPEQLKTYFKEHNWDTIIGFQTRNPMHKSHFELTKYALQKVDKSTARLLIHPIVGVTQEDDIDYTTRIKCYKEILKEYPKDKVCLSLLPLSMRMSGPREACFHALIRKNYGCTHFIVGRDHAGPSTRKKNGEPFYGEYEAQNLVSKHANTIKIIPIFSTNIIYNKNDSNYYPESEFPIHGVKCLISGTQLRKMLRNNEDIPEWFSFKEVINILRASIKKRGVCFYFTGLSCSGKSSHARGLMGLIKEKYPEKEITLLDGDEVRNHLSKNLGFSKSDRSINVRRIGWVASEIVKHGGIVICSSIAPYENDRNFNREIITSTGGKYIEIYVDTGIEICESRDIKNLYKRARTGEIKNFTGINDPFEIPTKPEIVIKNNDINWELMLITYKNFL